MAGQLWELGAWTGATGDPTSFHETSSTVFLLGYLGKVFAVKNSTLFDPGVTPRLYQMVQRSSTDDQTLLLPGSKAMWKSYDNCVVTTKATDAYDGAGINHVAGVFCSTAPLAGEYCFIQVGGQGPVNVGGAPTSAPDTSGKPILAGAANLVFDCVADWNDPATGTEIVAKAITAVNAGSIGATVCEAILFPCRVGW